MPSAGQSMQGVDLSGGQPPSRSLPGGLQSPELFMQFLSSQYDQAILALGQLIQAEPDEQRRVKIEGIQQKLKEQKVDRLSEIQDGVNQARAFMSGVAG